MSKTGSPSSFPQSQEVGSRPAASPNDFVHQPAPANAPTGRAPVPPTRPAHHQGAAAYVDPYLFETGYYSSRAEYEELSGASASRIQLRADVENARPKRERRSK